MHDVLNRLEEDHRRMEQLLNLIERELDVFAEGGAPDYELLSLCLDYCRDYPALVHHPVEDALGEKLKARDDSAAPVVERLEQEHEKLEASTDKFAQMVSDLLLGAETARDQVVAAGRAFLADTRAHITAEDKHVFPLMAKSLTAADLDQVQMRKDPLVGGAEMDRFRRVIEEIQSFAQVPA